MSASLNERAREALQLVDANPAKSALLARAVVHQAHQNHEFAPMSIAEQVLGMTALQLEDPDTALRHLRTAIRLGRRAGSAELVAEAQMRLAFALNVRGRGGHALREIETALSGLNGVARARARAQRGAILLQLGRLDEALSDYQSALSILRRAGDHLWVQRVVHNRGILYGYRQEFTAAEADLYEAAQLCTNHGLDLSLGFVHENLGWISGLRGDVPAALHHLEVAEQRLRAHSAAVGELLTDKCQLDGGVTATARSSGRRWPACRTTHGGTRRPGSSIAVRPVRRDLRDDRACGTAWRAGQCRQRSPVRAGTHCAAASGTSHDGHM